MRFCFPLVLLALSLSACTSSLPVLNCDNSAVTGSIDRGPTEQVIRTADLAITGTATSGGLALRSLQIGNRPATSVSANFATWSASIPVATLVTLADAEGDPDGDGVASVELAAVATDSCGVAWPIGKSFRVNVDLTPEVLVSDLDVDVVIPSGKTYIPIDGTAVAALTLSAEASGSGAVVALSTSLGITSAPEDGVVLGGDGRERAAATILFYAESMADVGTALVTATSEGQIASTAIRIAGPPRLSPETLVLEPGQRELITVSSEGDIDSCVSYAETTSDIVVTAAGIPLSDAAASDGDGDGVLEILLEVRDDLDALAELRLRCCDSYDQCTDAATGLYTAGPPG